MVFFFLTCPFKEKEGKREGLQWSMADAGVLPRGCGFSSHELGRDRRCWSCASLIPVPSGQAVSRRRCQLPGVISLGMFDR